MKAVLAKILFELKFQREYEVELQLQTRMHSSKIRTARMSIRRGGSPPGTPQSRHPPPEQTRPAEQTRLPKPDTPLGADTPGADTPQEQTPPKSRHPSRIKCLESSVSSE